MMPFGMNNFGMNMGMGGNMGLSGGMPNFNNYNNMNMMANNNDDDEWMKGFQMGVEEVNNVGNNNYDDSNTPGPKVNLIFQTTVGAKRTMKFNYGTTISQAIRRYLESVGKPELFGQDILINFLYNATRINFNDNTPIENKFGHIINPKIVVNDTKGLIGA